ncbi:MAG: UbiH/UbiF/VisC/COQ6 family ubiquinone biosynthesis hydroxylase [Gammaproteobacteria bacterium]|nr:UbiH/UbiF/VisC/COQ6 family ubiquinone biosynthesis hydroxylase [Gammaproteobacteria bacterium]
MSKQDNNIFDVIIVGGGMVGLSMALLLARGIGQDSGFKLALVDGQKTGQNVVKRQRQRPPAANENISRFSPRVSALSHASQTLFESLELWQTSIAPHACPYENMYVWDAEGTGNINFSALDIHQSNLGHIVENNVITEALLEALTLHTNLKLFNESQVSAYQAQAEYQTICLEDGTELQSNLIIAADGANSFIRQEADFDIRSWSYQHQALVTTVQTEKPHNFTAAQCFLRSGPLAFLPLLDQENEKDSQFYSSIVWSCDPEKATLLMDMDKAAFQSALQEAFENRLGSIQDSVKRFAFPLWQRHAASYVKPGLALIGDAAHSVHPLAGQGVNLGLLDAVSLYEVIRQASDKGEDFSSEQVLSRYQRQRKGHNLSMMALMETFKRGFESDDLMIRWMRNVGLSFVDKVTPIKHQLMKKAIGL